MKKIIIYIWPLFLFLISCEKDSDIDLPTDTTVIVANSLFNPDSTWRIQVSMSQGVQNTSDINMVSEAEVNLLDENDDIIEVLTEDSPGNYISTSKPIENSLYKLNINYSGQTVTAEAIVPEATEIDSINIKAGKAIDPRYNREADYLLWEINIKDDIDEDNYYFLTLEHVNNYNNIEYIQYRELEGNEQIFEQFQSVVSVRDKVLFTDASFNGKTKSIKTKTLVNGFDLPYGDSYYRFVLYTCSKEMYNYMLSVYYQWDQTGFEHSNKPIRINSNIEGGLGVFAAFSAQKLIVSTDELSNALNNLK